MSEYWKSTPKYWCKFCKLFVRDTSLEKKQHEATPKHQSSIQRSLRELHKTTERDEREKQRAKDEVARLNGIVGGKPGASGSNTGPGGFVKNTAPPAKATPEERKRQMEQLAAMGITVPREFSKELAAGSEWATVSETPVYHYQEGDEEKKIAASAFGVRKRKLDEDEEEAETVVRKGWGSKFKSYPGSKGGDEDLDALLSGTIVKKKDMKKEEEESEDKIKKEDAEGETRSPEPRDAEAKDGAILKKEESAGDAPLAAIPDADQVASVSEKQEEATPDPPVVFKKRKGKR